MKQNLLKGISVLSIGVLLVGCQDANQDKSTNKETKTETTSKSATKEHVHEHSHGGHEMTKGEEKIYKGIFKDEQVKDRPLTDWEGDWQSVYPYLQDGTLDEVFEHKAEEDDSKTAKEYKEYYTTGYKQTLHELISVKKRFLSTKVKKKRQVNMNMTVKKS